MTYSCKIHRVNGFQSRARSLGARPVNQVLRHTLSSVRGGHLLHSQRNVPVWCASTGEDTLVEAEEVGQHGVGDIVGEKESPHELVYVEPSNSDKAMTFLKLMLALPWRRFKKGSALTMKLGGKIAEEMQSRFSSTQSLPDICNSLRKAAYDPRIKGIVVKIDPLECGWAKVQEIKRHVSFFRQSGKWAIAYMERAGEKEYYLASAFGEIYAPPSASVSIRGLSVKGTFLRGTLEKIGIEPEVKRIGKYKSAGDQLLRKDMSEAQKEQLSDVLDDIYQDFLQTIAGQRGKSVEEVEAFVDQGVYDMKILKDGNWIDDLKYEDEINDMIKERTDGKEDELRFVKLKKYAKVSPSAFGLNGKKTIAIVRTSGAILPGSGQSGAITAEAVIAKLRALKKNKRVAAVVLRVDSPGGDALASDLMWREIQKFGEEKPIIASMADVAASGGYYMSMACQKIVAEPLTLTGSIGVVTGKFNLSELYEKAGYHKQTIARGKYAQLLNESKKFTDEEAELFDKAAEYAYSQFRDKAAASRGMDSAAMELVAQGRVWSGKRAAEKGLVDRVGGLWSAIALAKQAAEIDADENVTVKEVSRGRVSPIALVTGGAMLQLPEILEFFVLSLVGNAFSKSAELVSATAFAYKPLVDLSKNDSFMMEGLNNGRVMAQTPELSVEGSFSETMIATGGNISTGQSESIF